MKSTLREITGRSDSANSNNEPASDESSPAATEELESLGYLSGGADSDMLMVAQNPEVAEEIETGDDESGDISEQDDISDPDGEDGENSDSEEDETPVVTGQKLIGGQGLVPRGWPEDVMIMEEFEVRYGSADQHGLKLVVIGPGTAEEIREFYTNTDDWVVSDSVDSLTEEDPNTGESVTKIIVFLSRDDEFLVIDIVERDEETLVQLKYTAGN